MIPKRGQGQSRWGKGCCQQVQVQSCWDKACTRVGCAAPLGHMLPPTGAGAAPMGEGLLPGGAGVGAPKSPLSWVDTAWQCFLRKPERNN
jgi:hypothetical protein